MVNANDDDPYREYNYFHQEGRKVFKEVCPMAAAHIEASVEKAGLAVSDIKRWWLHQANINMNDLIARRLLGRDPNPVRRRGVGPVRQHRLGRVANCVQSPP